MSQANDPPPQASLPNDTPDKPTRARRRRTPQDWKPVFLERMAETGIVSVAAKAARISRQTAYHHRNHDPDFASAWDEAFEVAADVVEEEVRRRAIDGWEEPVFYQGEVVGHIRKWSDRMLELHAKRMKPALYRERVQVEQTVHSEAMSNLDAEILKSLKEVALADPKLREVFAQQLLANPEFVAQLAGVVPQGQEGVPSPTESP